MTEIVIYNLLFWAVYYQVCKLPERMVQAAIDAA